LTIASRSAEPGRVLCCAAVAVQLMKLLIVLLSMLLLRCRFAVLIIGASLTNETALRGDIHRIALVDVCKGVFWNSDFLALMLLRARRHEVE